MSDDAPDPQDLAEALDCDKLGTADDVDVEPDFPFDQLLGADEFGTTAAEEHVGEPIDERVERELPDPVVEELESADAAAASDAATTSVAAQLDALELQLDEATLAVVDDIDPALPVEEGSDEVVVDEVGRLLDVGVDEVTGLDDESQSLATAVAEGDLSAEESAIHLTQDPPMGRDPDEVP